MAHHDTATHYRTQDVDGLKVFYREAGRGRSPDRPAPTWVSNVVAHVPRLDSPACASFPRDRSLTSQDWVF